MSLITPDFGLLVWMTLIFLIVFFILAKFGFPMITGMVDRRSERIGQSLEKAREAERRLSEVAGEQAALLEQARKEQARILKEAAESRDRMVEQAREQAKEEAAKIIDKARTEIESEREQALRDIRSQVASLSIDIAEQMVRKDLSQDSAQMALLDSLVDEIQQSRPS